MLVRYPTRWQQPRACRCARDLHRRPLVSALSASNVAYSARPTDSFALCTHLRCRTRHAHAPSSMHVTRYTLHAHALTLCILARAAGSQPLVTRFGHVSTSTAARARATSVSILQRLE